MNTSDGQECMTVSKTVRAGSELLPPLKIVGLETVIIGNMIEDIP
jgi:hypothetical protein